MISTFLGTGIAFMFFGGCASAKESSRLAYNDEGLAPVEVEMSPLPESAAAPSAEFTGPADTTSSATVSPTSAPTKATVSDLAATYEADLAALASMQASAAAPSATVTASGESSMGSQTVSQTFARSVTPTTADTATPPTIEWSDGTTGAAPDRLTSMRSSAQRDLLDRAAAAANASIARSTEAPMVAGDAAAPALPEQTTANEPLSAALPTPATTTLPIDAQGIATKLASTLSSDATTSATPMRQLLALSALAVTDPTIELPKDLSTHLTDEERATAEKFHAAFVRIGRDLQEGKDDAALVSTIEQLLTALKPAPMLALPRVEFCTRVQAFGQIDPIDNRRFLAATSPRVIVYSELENFVSAMADAKWTTRLATKISILTERDGVEVWRRSPEWTAVVDASDVKRDDFFVGEIVTLSPHLSVGSYVLKMTIRDEATATVAEKSVAFQVVADPTMVTNAG